MKLSKKILKSQTFQNFACWLAHKYIKFVYYTTKWQIIGAEYKKQMENSNQPFIVAFWHGRLFMIPPFAPKGVKIHVLISTHNDGELIARTMTHFKFSLIRGSTNKDGIAAFKSMLRTIKNKETVAITPDGPKGPGMRVTGGITKLAQMTETTIVPMTFSVSKCKILRSWDSFMAAKPFGKGCFIYGEPITIKRCKTDEELEKARILIENSLNNITKQADKIVGIEPIKPDSLTV